jgi:hypothetical protein
MGPSASTSVLTYISSSMFVFLYGFSPTRFSGQFRIEKSSVPRYTWFIIQFSVSFLSTAGQDHFWSCPSGVKGWDQWQ